jgi:hypothetical protein
VAQRGEPGSETWKDKNNAWRTGNLYLRRDGDPDSGKITCPQCLPLRSNLRAVPMRWRSRS